MTDKCFVNMFPDINSTMQLLNDLIPTTNDMDYVAFGSFFCMLIEEWCLAHDEDATQFANTMAEMIHAVNNSMGKYQRDTPLFDSEVF